MVKKTFKTPPFFQSGRFDGPFTLRVLLGGGTPKKWPQRPGKPKKGLSGAPGTPWKPLENPLLGPGRGPRTPQKGPLGTPPGGPKTPPKRENTPIYISITKWRKMSKMTFCTFDGLFTSEVEDREEVTPNSASGEGSFLGGGPDPPRGGVPPVWGGVWDPPSGGSKRAPKPPFWGVPAPIY